MRIVISDFISLDGVVQGPGGREEDTDGGFEHGGWSMPFFDPDAMGPVLDEVLQGSEALSSGGGPGRPWRRHGTIAPAIPSPIG